MSAWFRRVVLSRTWLSFVVLCASFVVFGLCTLNLVFSLKANVELIAEHGTQALGDGALEQFVELVFMAIVAMAAYIVFKACEYRLVHVLADPPNKS
jgi:hypothetical protein